jgi:hypothetical protein
MSLRSNTVAVPEMGDDDFLPLIPSRALFDHLTQAQPL